MLKRRHQHIHLTGRIQGVFFRASVKELAEGLGITGRVRNNPDGSVTIEAEGDDLSLQDFIQWCHHGPPKARVDRVEIEQCSLQYYDDFRIV